MHINCLFISRFVTQYKIGIYFIVSSLVSSDITGVTKLEAAANDDDDEELQNQQEHGQANNRHDELNCSYVSEYDSSANVPTTKRRKGKIYQDLKGRIVYKRNNDQYCITRWRLLNPYGAESEEYFEQLLLKRCVKGLRGLIIKYFVFWF